MGKFILVEGTDPDGFYDLSSYNNGVFPFEVRKYKYLHLRNSQDMSGSQCIVKLDEDKPYELISDRFSQKDVLYDRHNTGSDIVDNTLCDWYIQFNISEVLERIFTPQDEEYFNQYIVDPNTKY